MKPAQAGVVWSSAGIYMISSCAYEKDKVVIAPQQIDSNMTCTYKWLSLGRKTIKGNDLSWPQRLCNVAPWEATCCKVSTLPLLFEVNFTYNTCVLNNSNFRMFICNIVFSPCDTVKITQVKNPSNLTPINYYYY